MATLQNFGTVIPLFGGNTADGGFFSPVENAYWRGFSRVCVDYNTVAAERSASFSKQTITVPGLLPHVKILFGESAMYAIPVFAPARCGGAL